MYAIIVGRSIAGVSKMYDWKLLKSKNKGQYRCKCWMTDSCAPCPEPPWRWASNNKKPEIEVDPQKSWVFTHDGVYLGLIHGYK